MKNLIFLLPFLLPFLHLQSNPLMLQGRYRTQNKTAIRLFCEDVVGPVFGLPPFERKIFKQHDERARLLQYFAFQCRLDRRMLAVTANENRFYRNDTLADIAEDGVWLLC